MNIDKIQKTVILMEKSFMSFKRQIATLAVVITFFLSGFFAGTTWHFSYYGEIDIDTPRMCSKIILLIGIIMLLFVLFYKSKKKVTELETDIENIGKK